MRAFLIDFENVKSAGLVGIDTLGIDDQVVILYSVNSNTISFEMHQKIMSCAASGYLPTDCVVYRRPNIAMSVAHSVFTGKPITPSTSSDVHEVDVTVTDSAAYQQFEMEREPAQETEEVVEIVAEQQDDGEDVQAEANGGTDDFETAALLGALQAAQQQELEEEQKKKTGWEETEALSAAARMRQAELDAEEEE